MGYEDRYFDFIRLLKRAFNYIPALWPRPVGISRAEARRMHRQPYHIRLGHVIQ